MNHENEVGQLVEVDVALESMRDSGYDLPTAVGEVVDNSIEAKARNIKIHTNFVKGKTKEITEMAFSDDGVGIPPDILHNILTLGYSTRYNQRNSLGRFGMGLKVASISHARRIELYTRQEGGSLYYTHIDLVEIKEHKQSFIQKRLVEDYPERYKYLMCDEKGKEYPAGTLVVWSKIDRLVNHGRYASSLDKKMGELLDFLARAYRYFLSQGLNIYLDGKRVFPYDPLFLLENPRVTEKAGEDYRAEVIAHQEVDIDKQKVEFTVTLLPEIFRLNRGEGGKRGQAKQFEFLHLADNAGKVSIMRNGREIYYNIIPKSLPGGKDDLDRFIGIEIKFPAQLDEYFQVRNVKRGAEPMDALREQFKEFVDPSVRKARTEIRKRWAKTETENAARKNEHEQAIQIVAKADKTAPGGRAGMKVSDAEVEEIISHVLEDMSVDSEADPELAAEKRKELLENPVSIVTSSWPGKELFEIDHLKGHPIVKLNGRHPFFRDIYRKLKMIAGEEEVKWREQDFIKLASDAKVALELLFMAYAKAESLNPQADEAYSALRSYWGIFTDEYMNGLTDHRKM